jgi:nucleotide-binding universal stress UspA family protein
MKPSPSLRGPLPGHLLVAVDAEGHSDPAVRLAAVLARQLGARLSFVHAIGNPVLEWGYNESPRDASTKTGLTDRVAEALDAHVRRAVSAAGEKVPAGELVQVEIGRPGKVIADRAREIGADCVVLGPHQKRGVFDFGSTARFVLGHATTVWVQPIEPRPIRRILVPVDLSDASMRALTRACVLGKKLAARVQALHCFDSLPIVMTPLTGYPEIGAALPIDEMRAGNEKAFTRAMTDFDWQGAEHETSFFDARPEEKIEELAGASDLVVMSTHGRTGIAGAVMGHVAYSVLKNTRVPVWAIREA